MYYAEPNQFQVGLVFASLFFFFLGLSRRHERMRYKYSKRSFLFLVVDSLHRGMHRLKICSSLAEACYCPVFWARCLCYSLQKFLISAFCTFLELLFTGQGPIPYFSMWWFPWKVIDLISSSILNFFTVSVCYQVGGSLNPCSLLCSLPKLNPFIYWTRVVL